MKIPLKLSVFFLLLPLCLLLSSASCKKQKTETYSLIEYVKSNDIADSIRIYQPKNEGPASRILLKQKITQVSDTVTEFEFTWLRPDSIPINMSVERYSTSNRIEFIKQSFFEAGRFLSVNEIEATFIEKKIYHISDSNFVFEARFTFEADKDVTMNVKAKLRYDQKQIDSLDSSGQPCLVLTSTESIRLEFPDDRTDTTLHALSQRYFVKGRGLVMFSQKNDVEFAEYHLVE